MRAKEEIHRNLKNIKHDDFSVSNIESTNSPFHYRNKPFQILKTEYVYKEEKRQGAVRSLLFKFHVFNVTCFYFEKLMIYVIVYFQSMNSSEKVKN